MRSYSSIILIIVAVLCSASSCSDDKTIKIGMIAGLTGRVADLGIAGRDGVILAVEEANASGGINGKYVELIIKDDKQNPAACEKALADMLVEKVSAIVGPMTSSMGMVVVPHINKHSIPTISPTVSTTELTGIDDYFFRIIPDISNVAVKTADYIYQKQDYRRLLVIHDQGNSAFTEPWFQTFKSHFETLGGEEVASVSYVSRDSFNFFELIQQVDVLGYDCLIILASALDTAMISQQLRKKDIVIPIIASEWASTEDILEYGGNAVEGIEILHSFDKNDQSAIYLSFTERFRERFGYTGSFAAAYSYNAAKILLEALAKEKSPEKIKSAILAGSPYDGVQRKIQFNQYGDVLREYTLLKIRGNRIGSP